MDHNQNKPDFTSRLRSVLENLEYPPDVSDIELEEIISASIKAIAWEDNVGKQLERIKHNPVERAFHDQWLKENEPCAGVNNGNGILQDLFIDRSDGVFGSRKIDPITSRERMIVATIIQWLGTNCGLCFLNEALKRAGGRIVWKETNNENI